MRQDFDVAASRARYRDAEHLQLHRARTKACRQLGETYAVATLHRVGPGCASAKRPAALVHRRKCTARFDQSAGRYRRVDDIIRSVAEGLRLYVALASCGDVGTGQHLVDAFGGTRQAGRQLPAKRPETAQ